MTTAIPVCAGCAHFEQGRCAAYPHGIPPAVLYGHADHRLPLPNDRGVQFEPIDDPGRELVEAVFGTTPVAYDGEWPGRDPHAT